MDLEQIKRNYADFEDYKIEHLAKNDVCGLDADVVQILVEEIKKRGLDSNLIKAIEAQTKEFTEVELSELISKIVNLPCPDCRRKSSPLMGAIIRTVRSYVLITSYKKVLVIACPECLKKRRKEAMILTSLLGWWGIPMGIFQTPIALIASLKDVKNQEMISNQIISSIAVKNIGELKTNWDNENELVKYFIHKNENEIW